IRNVANPLVPGQPEWVSPHVTPANPGTQDQFTQELQFLGEIGDFNYLLGLYYYDETVNETINTILNVSGAPTVPASLSLRRTTLTNFQIESQSYAAFAQLGWRPSFADGRLEIVGGLRYTQDDKSL